MEEKRFSKPLDLQTIKIMDEFWCREQELVRKEVIPYQWEALNDRVEGAAPSYCIHNFKVAGRMLKEKSAKGSGYIPPTYTYRGFEALPEDLQHPEEDKFYGFLFQDSDFSKWIEAVAYSLAQSPDQELEKIADDAIELVCQAQLENGYLDTYYIINGMDRSFTNLKDHHELYCLGHLVEGAVAYYQATKKRKLLDAAIRFADYCDSYFGLEEGKSKGYPGHEIAEMALVRLYEITGEEKYLNLSKFFLDQRGTKPNYFEGEEEELAKKEGRHYIPSMEENKYSYYQAHLPVREQSEAMGHAVRAVYLYSGMADIARICQDEAMELACQRLWDSITREKLYITGGIGGTPIGEAFSFPYDLPNDTAYSETCAAIGLVFFARRMLQIRPKGEYGDVMELALYNTILSGMALDGKSFFYVNPLEVKPEACQKDKRKAHVKSVRQKWFGCACCPPNIARILSSISSYAYTENETTLWFHLYMSSKFTKKIDDKILDVKVESKMPWEGAVNIKLHGDNVLATLAFRIPNYGKDFQIKSSNSTIETKVIEEYVYCTGIWGEEDSIDISFAMPTMLISSNSKVRENIGKVAVKRGPITYCLEEIDNGPELHLCTIITDNFSPKVEVYTELGHTMNRIKLLGKRRIPQEEQLYQMFQAPEYVEVELCFVPYYAWNNRGEGEMAVWVSCD